VFEFALEGKDESMNHSDIEKLKEFQAPVLEDQAYSAFSRCEESRGKQG